MCTRSSPHIQTLAPSQQQSQQIWQQLNLQQTSQQQVQPMLAARH
jgi:hypothetical protein